MKKALSRAIVALIVTILLGYIGAVFGHDLMNDFVELGPIVAVAVMGAFIIFFGEQNKK